jgi:hypothetical protein
MKMTNCYHETLQNDVLAIISEWEQDNAHVAKHVRPGIWDETLDLNDIEYLLDHIRVD